MKAHVWVMLKPTVLDPQGSAIQQALASLGHTGVRDVARRRISLCSILPPGSPPLVPRLGASPAKSWLGPVI